MDSLTVRDAGRARGVMWLVVILALSMLAAPALAQKAPRSANKVELQVVVERPGGDDDELRRLKQKEMARLAAERIRLRLKQAGIKHFQVEVETHGVVRVTAYGESVDRALLAGIVIPNGFMQLRPVQRAGAHWMSIVDAIPEGIELRQEEDSFLVEDAYLWSPKQRPLKQFVDQVAVGGAEVLVYPEDGGWRTLTLGKPLASQADLQAVEIRKARMGAPFITLTLNDSVAARIRKMVNPEEVSELAVVLDDEVVGVVRYNPANFGHLVQLSCPPNLKAARQQRVWVSQVAGRLAAPIPVTLAENRR